MDVEILYEDNHLLVVNKPPGLLVHSDKTQDETLEDILKGYLKRTYNKPGNVYCRSVHRLDRPVSGVLMFAKTSKAHERMAYRFKSRDIIKLYWALSRFTPGQHAGTVEQFLHKDRERNLVTAFHTPGEDRKRAETHYRIIGKFGLYSLFELIPVTGRSHQLRVMMKTIGCPVGGDVKYGGEKIGNPRLILLHARSLAFPHPVTKVRVTVTAHPPQINAWKHLKDSVQE